MVAPPRNLSFCAPMPPERWLMGGLIYGFIRRQPDAAQSIPPPIMHRPPQKRVYTSRNSTLPPQGECTMVSMRKEFSTVTWVLIPVAIALNIAVGQIVYTLKLPLYLDSIGTILVGVLAG